MSLSFLRDYRGCWLTMDGEGSSGTPVDFEYFYQGTKGFMTGLQQYPKVHGSGTESDPHELCENNANEWTVTGDIGTLVDEGVDVSKGSYSIKGTKSGSGAFVTKWNGNGTFENEFSVIYSFFNLEAADRIKLEIKPSNAAIHLDAIKIWTDSNNAGHDTLYYIRHTNGGAGWTLSAGVWNEIEELLRDFNDPYQRFYGQFTNQIDLEFSGGVATDTILIDGLRLEHPDAGIKKHGASTYVSTYAVRILNSYFKQEYSINIDLVAGCFRWGFGGLHSQTNYQFDWGGENYAAGEPLFPINITFDAITTDGYLFRSFSNYATANFNNVNMTAYTWMERHGKIGSTPGAFYAGTSIHKFNYCKIISGDFIVTSFTEFRNCTIMGYRYPIWGPDAVLDNVNIINVTSDHCWVDYGELRNANFVDWFVAIERTIIYNRQYRQVTPRTLTVIDATHDSPNVRYPRINQRKYWITEEQRVVDQICKFGFTMNVKVKGSSGYLQNATVKLVDTYNITVFEVLTDINGDIIEQDIITQEHNIDNPLPDIGSHSYYLYPWNKGDTRFDTINYPFILTIEKEGYALYRDENFELWKPYNQEIMLQEPVYYQELIAGDVSDNEVSGQVSQLQVKGTVSVETSVGGNASEKKVPGLVETVEVSGTKNN